MPEPQKYNICTVRDFDENYCFSALSIVERTQEEWTNFRLRAEKRFHEIASANTSNDWDELNGARNGMEAYVKHYFTVALGMQIVDVCTTHVGRNQRERKYNA